MEARNESSEMPADWLAVPPLAKASLNDVGAAVAEAEEDMPLISIPRLAECSQMVLLCI